MPVEVLLDDCAVSYVPSGSVFARLRKQHRPFEGTSLLVLGDPLFDVPDTRPHPEPPDCGVLLKVVLPGSHAARVGLRSGDVLLTIAEQRLDSIDALKSALSRTPATATFWREGKIEKTRLLTANLGVVVDPRSAKAAVRAWREAESAVVPLGTGHKRLPGTRLEVEALARLVPNCTRMLGSNASEQQLDRNQGAGKLRSYRLIHLATHGDIDRGDPGRSALILAQDRLPNALDQVRQGKKVHDGRLTVSAIRGEWDLDADLVVLSACQTGLGPSARGDGLLGYAQAFLHKGARTVVLLFPDQG